MTKDMNAKEMIQLLHDSHMVLSDKMRKAMDDCEAEDPVTADLFMQKLHWHHMQVWMLKSCLVV
jgi:DNA-binding ferritin-like protein